KYQFRVAAAQASNFSITACKIFSDVITITENDIPIVNATNNSPQCIGGSVVLTVSEGASFEWTGPQGYKNMQQQASISPVTEAASGYYYVKVISAQGCINRDSTLVTLETSPVVNAGEDINICRGKTAILAGAAAGYTELNWLPSSTLSDLQNTNPLASPQDSTQYILRAGNGVCEIFDTVAVNVYDLPSANAGEDKVTIKGNPVLLDGSAGGTAVTYTWSPNTNISSPNVLQPLVSPETNSLYILEVESGNGCGLAADSVFVKVYQQLFIPNAFSPNGDGINDTWKIETLAAFPKAELKVFNRFGEIVFDNKRGNVNWNGKYKNKEVQLGTYPYILDLKNGAPVLKGFVILIR
ncbi:MAG: gliding motility-associated C-terminal domain-containing protein, partial [Ginsengibacter sp.]